MQWFRWIENHKSFTRIRMHYTCRESPSCIVIMYLQGGQMICTHQITVIPCTLGMKIFSDAESVTREKSIHWEKGKYSSNNISPLDQSHYSWQVHGWHLSSGRPFRPQHKYQKITYRQAATDSSMLVNKVQKCQKKNYMNFLFAH